MNHGLTTAVVRLLEEQLKKPRKAKDNLVYLNPILLWVGILCTGVFLIPGLIVPLCMGQWSGENVCFLLFAAGSSTMIVGFVNCRIRYTEEGFTAKYFLGYKRTFSYAEIESIQGWNRDVKLKVRGCTVRVDEIAVGKMEFLRFAKKQYRTHSGGKPIPEVKKSRWDIFNGHVDSPGELLIAYGLIALFMPALMILMAFVSEPAAMEELTCFTAPAQYSDPEEYDLVLYGNGQELEIQGYRFTLEEPDAFLRLCDSGERFTMGYRTVKDDDGNITSYSVEYIEDSSGRVWITPEDAWRIRQWNVTAVFGLVEIICLAYCGISIYIGRNPHKFSKKTIRLFFKDGYVH